MVLSGSTLSVKAPRVEINVETALTTFFNRARRQRIPLTTEQAHRHKCVRLGLAVAQLAFVLLIALLAGAAAWEGQRDAATLAWLVGSAALAAYLVRVVRRRWQRL